MTYIAEQFFEKHRPKRLIKLNLDSRDKVLKAIENTEGFELKDLFRKGYEVLDFLNPKKRKRAEMKLAFCLIEIKDGKIITFVEQTQGETKIFFWEGRRSDKKYGKRIFSDDELLTLDDSLGAEEIWDVYECDSSSRPTGEFFTETEAKTWRQAIENVKKERPTKKYYNANIRKEK